MGCLAGVTAKEGSPKACSAPCQQPPLPEHVPCLSLHGRCGVTPSRVLEGRGPWHRARHHGDRRGFSLNGVERDGVPGSLPVREDAAGSLGRSGRQSGCRGLISQPTVGSGGLHGVLRDATGWAEGWQGRIRGKGQEMEPSTEQLLKRARSDDLGARTPQPGPGHRVPLRGQGHSSGGVFLQSCHSLCPPPGAAAGGGGKALDRCRQLANPARRGQRLRARPLLGWEPGCRPWTSSSPLNWSQIPRCWLEVQETAPRSR